MSFESCGVPNCIYQILIDESSCAPCGNGYCFYHSKHPSDACWILKRSTRWPGASVIFMNEPEISQLIDLMDTDVITSEVETLRPGHRVAKNSHEVRQGYHYGVYSLESEVAAIQALKRGGIRVPMTFLKPADSKHHFRLQYCYQSFIQGHIRSVAKWFISLENTQFDKIGSPTFSNGDIVIGPLIERQPPLITPPYFNGPYRNLQERYLSTIDTRLNMLRARIFTTAQEELDSYLVLLELKEIILGSEELEKDGTFFIRHGDDHWDHMRATEDGEVTGVIDWEWAYTTSKEEAFSAPGSLLPHNLMDSDNDKDLSFHEEALVAAYESLGRADLGRCVRNGRKYSRLIATFKATWASVEDLRCLRRGFLGRLGGEYEHEETREHWTERMKIKHKDDEGLRYFLENPLPEPILPSDDDSEAK
ncbi:uncharacterized protein IL334_002428 [Kwoniella shivajii]|uniref:Aminoglycoside phosphotransferase domain-containing protein n=1 Tax=Kwoniella shivajii TaxID=564305 RepID=A0ABZ1CUQ2_9TREE|nr:hypothetical protein IL334_002428 [Kwoniella shivajii]